VTVRAEVGELDSYRDFLPTLLQPASDGRSDSELLSYLVEVQVLRPFVARDRRPRRDDQIGQFRKAVYDVLGEGVSKVGCIVGTEVPKRHNGHGPDRLGTKVKWPPTPYGD